MRPGVKIPPSLVNIYKELRDDLGIAPARHGFLEHWARQGVLLLNAVLTVEMGSAGAHAGRGACACDRPCRRIFCRADT